MHQRCWLSIASFLALAVRAGCQQEFGPAKLESENRIAEAFSGYLAAFQKAPIGSIEADEARAKVIDLAYRLDPVPDVSPEAMRHFKIAMTTLQAAPNSMPYSVAYSTAIDELAKAAQAAPWWPIAYYDLGLVQEITGRMNGALGNLQTYLQLDPGAPDVAQIRQKIAELESRQRSSPFPNSLGMRFTPVHGTQVAFSIWDTRVQDYQVFVLETQRKWATPKFPQSPSDPAVFVSWEDAKAFCGWLTVKDRTAGWIALSQRYRLPADAEWSIAIGLPPEKGITPEEKDTLVIRMYPWGAEWPPPPGAGNYAKTSAALKPTIGTMPVGSFMPNPLGLYDMGGNVWQWCEDLYAPGRRQRVLRGGSFADWGVDLLLSSARTYNMPDAINDYSGFRCVMAHTTP
jgi:hypothetical protein